MRTSPMFAIVAPPVSRPVNVALVIEVGDERKKSSADSISNLPALSGRDAAAIRLVTAPVLNVKGEAAAGIADSRLTEIATTEVRRALTRIISCSSAGVASC